MKKEIALNKLLSEINSFSSNGAYYGVVVHYWQNSFPYSSYGVDWRCEGLATSYINLYKLTKDKKFLNDLILLCDFALSKQKANKGFKNCAFEANPSFQRGAMPHEAAVVIALLKASVLFKELKHPIWKKYYYRAKQVVDEYIIPNYWNKRKCAFEQYELYLSQKENVFVPNKMATISEALYLLYKISGDNNYFKYGSKNISKSISLMDENGVSPQSETNNKKIVFYNSREIPALIDYGFDDIAKQKAEFISRNWSNGFNFCEIDDKVVRYPNFVAGAGGIIKSLDLVGKKTTKYEKYLISNMRKNGSIPAFYGLGKESSKKCTGPSLTDSFSVVGWMDKTLDYFSSTIKNYSLDLVKPVSIKVKCTNGIYYEDDLKIVALGKTYQKVPQVFSAKEFITDTESILSRAAYFPFKKLGAVSNGEKL